MTRSRTVREGTVGLLAVAGLLAVGGIILWLRNFEFGRSSYEITVEFPDVNGIQTGAPVRYRGYRVGTIEDIEPGTDGVDVTLEISPATLRIPRDVEILANSTGLIGETSVDITPLREDVPPRSELPSPLGSECDSNVIICEDEKIQGQPGPQLVPTLARLSNLYGSQEFFDNLNAAAKNTGIAATRIAALSDDLGSLSNNLEEELEVVTQTADSLSTTADETSRLINSANSLLSENRANLNTTLENVSVATRNFGSTSEKLNLLLDDTSQELSSLVASLEETVTQVNSNLESVDTEQLVENLETLTTNAVEISEDLSELTATLNDPTNAVVLQETLDSARVTFENTQKITSDLDELTGSPEFRNNLRELVNGLSNLVSSSQQLQQQIQTAQEVVPENPGVLQGTPQLERAIAPQPTLFQPSVSLKQSQFRKHLSSVSDSSEAKTN